MARGTVAALVSVFVAAFSHSLAGGRLPGVAGLALCLAFSVLVCVALAGRRLPRTRLAASVAASQAMYHWLFGALGSGALGSGTAGSGAAGSGAASSGAGVTTGMHGHPHDAALGTVTLAPQPHGEGDMLAAHLAAALVTFLVLVFGERTIAATVRFARALVVSLLPAAPDAPAVCAPARLFPSRPRIARPGRRRVDHSGLRHRGPPAASFA